MCGPFFVCHDVFAVGQDTAVEVGRNISVTAAVINPEF